MADPKNWIIIMKPLLSDETRIEYGAGPDSFSTYADYISGTKDVLLMIVESYRPYP